MSDSVPEAGSVVSESVPVRRSDMCPSHFLRVNVVVMECEGVKLCEGVKGCEVKG